MSWLPKSWRKDKDTVKERPKKAREEVKHRLPTQMKSKPCWCRNCFMQVAKSDVKCPQCGVPNRQPLKTKPRGV